MRSLWESILDSEEKITGRIISDSTVDKLTRNGVYYATKGYTLLKSAQETQLASYYNNELCFFTDNEASDITIDYKLAYDYLKSLKLKSIEAPRITIVNPGTDFSVFGTLKTSRLIINYSHIKKLDNLIVVSCREFHGTTYRNRGSSISQVYDFSYQHRGELGAHGLSIDIPDITVIDSKIDLENISCEKIEFINTKGSVTNILMYDPGIFDDSAAEKIFNLFDKKYIFQCIDDRRSQLVDRKTSTIRKLLAYFGNKHFYAPSSNPYKVTGKLRDLIDISGFKNIQEIAYHDNNYTITFTSDKTHAMRCQSMNKNKYTTNTHQLLPIEQTTDNYYCVITSVR